LYAPQHQHGMRGSVVCLHACTKHNNITVIVRP
jgi:hypothetical protein